MATVDRVSGDWYLTSLSGNIYIEASGGAGVTNILGDLVVIGRQTNLGSIETIVSDNIITLSSNITEGQPLLNAGIEVRRGDELTVAFIWNEAIDKWQVTENGLLFANLMVKVQDDPDPHLGGHLYLDGYEIRSNPDQNIVLVPGYNPVENTANAGIEIRQITGNLVPKFDSTVIYAKEPNLGHSGLYVSNSKSVDEELITKRKAIIYSLVL
jgi:hypothetical protein